MTLELNKQQYESLLKLIYLGDWMVNAIRLEDDRIGKYDEVAQRIYALAADAGLGEYVELDEEQNRYFPTRALDEDPEIEQYHEDYDDNCFWEELFYRLVDRDFVRTFGEKEIARMSFKERIEREEPFRVRYDEEFAQHGLDRLAIGE